MAKKTKSVLLLILALMAISGISALALWLVYKLRNSVSCPSSYLTTINSPRRSLGEDLLIKQSTNSNKQVGIAAFADCNFKTAITQLEASRKQNRNDPETLIYLNNAKAASHPTFKIVTSVPIGKNLDVSQEILRGVAMAQDEINQAGGINGRWLLVEIANDDNQPNIVKELAEEFVKDEQILAVVGHNSSDASLAAAPIYDQGKLVMISPTSTSSKLAGISPYVFRTVLSNQVMAQGLSEYISKNIKKKLAICFDSESAYSLSFQEDVKKDLLAKGIAVTQSPCDLFASDFNPYSIMTQINNEGADGILLIPSVDRHNQAIKLAQGNGGRLLLFGSETLFTNNTLIAGGANVKGMVLPVVWHPQAVPGHPFANNAFNTWGGRVNWRSATAYDATLAIIEGLKSSDNRLALQQKLATNFSTMGATGKVEFSPSGDRKGEVFLVRIETVNNAASGTSLDFVTLP